MKTYYVIEFQANNDGSCAVPSPLGFQVETQEQENAMISRYFSICAVAAESACDTHTVMITDSEGNVWRGYKQVLRHGHEVME